MSKRNQPGKEPDSNLPLNCNTLKFTKNEESKERIEEPTKKKGLSFEGKEVETFWKTHKNEEHEFSIEEIYDDFNKHITHKEIVPPLCSIPFQLYEQSKQ